MRLKLVSCVISACVSFALNAQIIIPAAPVPPFPPQKPDYDPDLGSDLGINDKYRPFLLFEGELGDKPSGEGVVILGPSKGGALTLDLLETLGSTDLDLQTGADLVTEVLDESEAARTFRERRSALSDLLKRDPAISLEVAVVRALDKVTGEVSELRVGVNQAVNFGTLEIVARTCQKSPPSEPPERAAFLQITDLGHKRTNSNLESPKNSSEKATKPYAFSGWMFASNPSISAMDHAVYDVWLVDCKKS